MVRVMPGEENKKGWFSDKVGKWFLGVSVVILILIWGVVGLVFLEESKNYRSHEFFFSCLDANAEIYLVDSGYTCIDKDSGKISLQVRRDVGDFNLYDIEISVISDDDEINFSLKDSAIDFISLPGDNEERRYFIDISSYAGLVDKINGVEISPIISSGKGIKECGVSDYIEIVRECNG